MPNSSRWSIPALLWALRQWCWRTDLVMIVVSGLLLLCCCLFSLLVLQPLDERTEQARKQLAVLSREPAMPARTDEADQALARFYAGFPAMDSRYDLIEQLYVAAAAQRLALNQGEYKLVREKEGKLHRIEMMLPVKGPYPQVRRFLAQAMREIPNLALEGITFQRQRIDEAEVEAQMRLTMYVREP